MIAVNSALYWRSPRRLLALALLTAGGVVLGWSLVPHHARTFAYAYAAVEPTCIGVLCVLALQRCAKHARWLVPLLLAGVMLTLAVRPHDTAFTAIGLTAGGLSIVASAFRHKHAAIAATLLCSVAIAAALLSGLAR
jgi:hypothetical protein